MVQNTKKGMEETTKKGPTSQIREEAERPGRTTDKSSVKKPDTSSSSKKSR